MHFLCVCAQDKILHKPITNINTKSKNLPCFDKSTGFTLVSFGEKVWIRPILKEFHNITKLT